MPVENTDYQVAEDKSNTEPGAEAESGSGGGVMQIWLADRATQLDRLLVGNVTNNASYELPQGVVNAAVGYQTDWQNQEIAHGVNATGTVAQADGSAMNGTAAFLQGGAVIGGADVSGSFRISVDPPAGIIAGGNQPLGTYDFTFEPDIPAVSIFNESVGIKYDLGVVQYGEVSGQVLDYNGEPVQNASVAAAGASTSTGSAGDYSLQAPGGTTVTFAAVGTSQDYTPQGGQTLTVDWQYAGIEANISIPTGIGVPNADVNIPAAGGLDQTDDSGVVQFVRAPAETAVEAFLLGGDITRTFTTNGQGENYVIDLNFGAGFVGTIYDADTGDPVSTVDVTTSASVVTQSKSLEDGRYVIGTTDTGEISVTVALNSRRFARADSVFDISDGDVVREDFSLEKRENIGTVV